MKVTTTKTIHLDESDIKRAIRKLLNEDNEFPTDDDIDFYTEHPISATVKITTTNE